MRTGTRKTFVNEINIQLRGANPRRRLFLERMEEDINISPKANRIYGSIGVAFEALDQLKDPSPFALPWLGAGMFAAKLGSTQGIPHVAYHLAGKIEEI